MAKAVLLLIALLALATQTLEVKGLPRKVGVQSGKGQLFEVYGKTFECVLRGSGSHRSLECATETDTLNKACACDVAQVVLVQALPTEVIVDPYELQALNDAHDSALFLTHGQVELERPAPLCQPVTVTVHLDAPVNASVLTASVPVHARYPALNGGLAPSDQVPWWERLSSGTRDALIEPPVVLARCKKGSSSGGGTTSEEEEQQPQQDGDWALKNVVNKGRSNIVGSEQLHWTIPSGNTQHSDIVGWVTSSVATLLMGRLVLCLLVAK